jgi:hypothetical protein
LSARRRRRRFEGWCTVQKWKQNCCSQVLSFSISMCVRQIRPIQFWAIFHWHYLILLFSCRYVLIAVWHKRLSIYRMALKALDTPLYTYDLNCQATSAPPVYFSRTRTDTNCSDDQSYRFGVRLKTVSMGSRRPPVPHPLPPPPPPICNAHTLLGSTSVNNKKAKTRSA